MSKYTVVDLKSTILVTRDRNFFKILQLESWKTEYINSANLKGACFKYPSDFIKAFRKPFGLQNVILSTDAKKFMEDLIAFNRIDS